MKKLIVIVGPTGIGKTKISIALAKKLGFEIISGDSVAIYKELNIGSAKPTAEEMQGVKHHLIDVLDPVEEYSVARFQQEARKIIDRSNNVIICGGTGLYIGAVLYDYEFLAKARNEDFLSQFQDYSNEELYAYLEKICPSFDREKIHVNNRKRVLRAIEIFHDTDKSIAEFNKKRNQIYDSYIIYLNVSNREVLYDRINSRVDQMVSLGLEKEVYTLYQKGIMPNAIGYKEWIPYFKGEICLESCITEIKKNSRHLAKRQMTWFKNQMDTHFYEVHLEDLNQSVNEIYQDVSNFLGKES